jgi:two-component system, cell cycle sensor histidine kinase and response regulator CckA
MTVPLRVLILEDRPADAKLMLRELRRTGYDVDWQRVETEADYLSHLDPDIDVILADGVVPGFDASHALQLLQDRGLNIPLIVITGSLSEERAVELMRLGAADYLLKDRLTRLGQAVTQTLHKRQLSAAKHQAEEDRKHFFSLALDLLCVAGFDGYFRDLNPAWETTLGWTVEELCARPHQEFLHPEDREASLANAKMLAPSSETKTSFVNRFRCKDGSYRRLFWNAAAVPSQGLIYAIARDITDQQRLEEQYRQAQKMEAVGRLAGGIAHDFNNLLTVILGYCELTFGSLYSEDPLRGMIQEIKKAAERAELLTRRLLAFSRKQILQPDVLDLNALLADTRTMLGRLIGEDVEIVFALAPDLWRVKADRGQLEQVVMNLAINARDAMPTGGKLRIETANVTLDEMYISSYSDAHLGDHVVLSVTDTGCGMDAAIQARIFEPFFTTKGPEHGTGLGLATVYGIVKQSGGHIEVHSQPDCGATFKIYLPRESGAPLFRKSLSTPDDSKGGSETVLIAEDEDAVRVLTRLALQREGYHVLEARHGREALDMAEQYDGVIHLLLTDLVMPNLSGRQLAEHLQNVRPGIKVLYVSGYMDDAIIRHGLLTANTSFLQKPFSPDVLAQKVREVLDK